MPVNSARKRDLGAVVCSAVLILLGGVFYFDTTRMVDSDSFVFPRAIILAMMVMAGIRLVLDLLRPEQISRLRLGWNHLRGLLMVVALAAAILLIPKVGFLPMILMAYLVILCLSMYERWTWPRRISYPVIAVLVVVGFYLLFEKMFGIQFP